VFNIFVYHDGDWVLIATCRDPDLFRTFMEHVPEASYTAW